MKSILHKISVIVLLNLILSSCFAHHKLKDGKIKAIERKQDELWARIDELETLVLKQQQEIQVMEENALGKKTSFDKGSTFILND